MNNARAITADFASLKWIDRRKVLQVICEVPSERAEEVLAKLGNPTGEGIPVAIAALEIQPDIKKDLAENAEKTKRKFEDLPYSQQAALLCKSERFRHDNFRRIKDGKLYIPNEDEAAEFLRLELDIKSRSELDDVKNTIPREKLQHIRDEYFATIRSHPEQRG